ncbi:hypothetical protein D3C75_938680 [compost metagenome]
MVQSQVPQHRSIAVSPGFKAMRFIVRLRHALCCRKLNTSFIKSYLGAMLSKTSCTNFSLDWVELI